MGISIGGPGGQGGTFACHVVEQNGQIVLYPRPNAPVFNDLELYLMGLLPPEQVRTQFVFNDQAAAQALSCMGQVFNGAVTPLTAQDVISHVGPRVPAAGVAPTSFRIATILVTRDGLASPEAMALYSWFADRAEARSPTAIHSGFLKQLGMPFYVATGGRASLDTHLTLPEPAAPSGFTATSIVGNTVTFAWTPGAGSVAPTGYVIEGGLTPGAVLGSISVPGTPTIFTASVPTGVFYVRLHALAGPQRGAASNEIRIVVNVPVPPSAPSNLLGLVNGTTLALAWQNTAGGGTPTVTSIDVTGALSASLDLPVTETFEFAGVPPGTYTFAVRSANAIGVSAASNSVTLTFPGLCTGPPAPPSAFTAGKNGGTITVAWSLPVSGPAPKGLLAVGVGYADCHGPDRGSVARGHGRRRELHAGRERMERVWVERRDLAADGGHSLMNASRLRVGANAN